MADLPPEPVNPSIVFDQVALDICGVFYTTIKRSQTKRWCLTIICLATRAVHLEVIHSMYVNSFMHALRRFIGRHGKPSKVSSDHGTNFVAAQAEIAELYKSLDSDKVQKDLANKGIEWKWAPPYASHHLENVERVHRTLRKLLNGVMNTQVLTDESLSTLLTEVEAILNSRPLTVASDDPGDLDPLTPNHFLSMKGIDVVDPQFSDKEVFSRKKWRHIQYLANLFWKRWREQYLTNLQDRSMWQRLKNNLKVNDIVIIVDIVLPRGQ